MKVILLVTGMLGFSLSGFQASAQDTALPVMASLQNVSQPEAAAIFPANSPEQAVAYYAAPENKTVPPGTTATKSMSEELSIWVENKEAVLKSYRRTKRRQAQAQDW
ncbi:hypothetical protein FVR03_14810 [Pontibacter qinzhouensis]|uniref:Uncharacterized protein n=1 Tax=Pontibacter qinzhouensis TaxID=2603253 RepID=A0A5C8JHJ7_9BACT|nr:hypothetical protein [Pontibacter qinzhouensis]TXK37800.1 hypothetical protein FVR03_14810 [Pontibacter qinzhouensis]